MVTTELDPILALLNYCGAAPLPGSSLVVRRRIERRMALHRIAKLVDYTTLLQRDARELQSLANELCLGATTFGSLEQILRERARLARVWVAGCGTGEDAYAIAELLHECYGEPLGVRIFATDRDAVAIDRARSSQAGRAPLREAIVFATHDLLRDPPLGHLDLVACRSGLVDLDADGKERLVRTFHQVLEPGGLLIANGAESAALEELFAVVSPGSQMYRRREVSSAVPVPPRRRRSAVVASRFDDEIDRELDARFARPVVVVDSAGVVVHACGVLDPFLVRVDAIDIRMIARPALVQPLCRGLDRAVTEQDVVVPGVIVDRGTIIDLRIHRMVAPALAHHYAIVFDAARGARFVDTQHANTQTRADRRVLAATLSAASEELRASKRAFLAAGDEISRLREELAIVDTELRVVKQTLERETVERVHAADDLANVLREVGAGIAIVDGDLRIAACSDLARRMWFWGEPRGRAIGDFVSRDVVDALAAAREAREPIELETAKGSERYGVRISPYRSERTVDALVLVFTPDQRL